jgi:hypothetical protein
MLIMLLVNALHEKGSAVREVWPNRFVEEAISPRHVFACVKAWRRVGSPALYQGGDGYRLFETLRVVKATGTGNWLFTYCKTVPGRMAQY